jgi:hypothetical protein
MKKLLLAATALLLTTPAHADGRSLMYLKGVAYAIQAKCPQMKVNHDPKIDRGMRRGDLKEFADGAMLIADVWGHEMIASDDEDVNCHNVCSIRSNTCYFVKE